MGKKSCSGAFLNTGVNEQVLIKDGKAFKIALDLSI